MASRITEYEDAHGVELAKRLHPGNVREAWTLLRMDGLEAIRDSVQRSERVWTGLDNGEVFAVFGIRSAGILADTGYPWLVIREDIADHGIAFLRTFKSVVEAMQGMFGTLESVVDAENVELLKMVRWVGYSVGGAQPMGYDGRPFCRITRKRGE